MSTVPLSRAYLQGLPEMRKQAVLNEYIRRMFSVSVQNAAAAGKTSILLGDMTKIMMDLNRPIDISNIHNHQMLEYTVNDIISGVQSYFPDCTVSYEEEWVQTNANTRTLQKGIRIDWS